MKLQKSQTLVFAETKDSKFGKKSKEKKVNVSMLAKYEIACLVGTHTFAYTDIEYEQSGYKFQKRIHKQKVKSRVISMYNDPEFGYGLILLTDDGPD